MHCSRAKPQHSTHVIIKLTSAKEVPHVVIGAVSPFVVTNTSIREQRTVKKRKIVNEAPRDVVTANHKEL